MGAGTWLPRRARRKRRERERTDVLAGHDLLTGAQNPGAFMHGLELTCAEAGDGGAAPAVICIDLQGVSEITERHGQALGEELLRRTSERLQGLLRGADVLARLSGERFAILRPGSAGGAAGEADGAADGGAADSAAVAALVRRVLARLAEPIELPGLSRAVCLSANAGVALWGRDGRDAATLLHHAELALLRAASLGRGHWDFYDASLDHAAHAHRALGPDLRQALAQGLLRLHYQPTYAGNGRTLLGYQALARWPHPARGFVPPAELMAVAQSTGQIEALDRWILHAACQEAATWPAQLSVAVALSAGPLRSGDGIRAAVSEALHASGLTPARLELGVTDAMVTGPAAQGFASLQALRSLGVRLSLSGFGADPSSLACLWRFPFDQLSIDGEATQGLGTAPRGDLIVRSIVQLAHSLSMKVIAQGVQTAAQRSTLRGHGCDGLQGPLLGPPVPRDRLPHREAEIVAVVVPEGMAA